MKKSKNKEVEIVKFEFYKLDPSKPVVAEGQRSALPWILLLVAIFFCAILAFIVIVNKDSDVYDESEYKIFYILCGVLLGVAVIVFIAYLIRNCRIRARIRNCDVTYATISSVVVEEYTTRDNDGDSRTKERVSLTYKFYDKLGNLRSEQYNKTYGKAPDFYEGQQIVVAFDETKCYVLSKYTLLDDGAFCNSYPPLTDNADESDLSGETVHVKPDKYVPLGYDVRFYISSAIYLTFALLSAALLTYFAITVKDAFVWVYICFVGVFFAVFAILAVCSFVVPYKVKRKYDAILSVGAKFTHGRLESTAKVFGNKTKYVCKYVDTDERIHYFSVNASLSKKLVRYGDTDVIVAYADDIAVALVEKVPLSKLIR